MSEPNPAGEEPYQLPGTQPAPEPGPDGLTGVGLTAADAAPFIAKEIG